MKVYNALQLKNGAKGEGYPTSSSLTQPIQFLSSKKKDNDWYAWNIDWLEIHALLAEVFKDPYKLKIAFRIEKVFYQVLFCLYQLYY